MLKVGLIGVGGISVAHIPCWEKFEDTELVALCDVRPEQMKNYSDKHCYTDFDTMLENETLDILDICLPTYLHPEYAVKAMEKGINVVCEKPISLKREDVKKIYAVAKENNVKFMVAQVLRFWDEYVFVKELIDTKKYGKLLSGSMQRLNIFPDWSFEDWMADEEKSGFVPFDLHIHDLDFLVYALGKPTEIKSFRSKEQKQDVIEVLYNFGGAYINCEATWYKGKIPFNANFRFQFEEAAVIYYAGKLTVYDQNGKIETDDRKQQKNEDTIGIPKSNGYANELRYFTDCVKNDTFPDKVKPEELEEVISILHSL
ncbi:MAG: Gfo/Idh/MocA family oxidoreductase [Clostridia bacterium]|nr:Gfo/Idh/MocA family oxidoreductase [Clostridia bacterium]